MTATETNHEKATEAATEKETAELETATKQDRQTATERETARQTKRELWDCRRNRLTKTATERETARQTNRRMDGGCRRTRQTDRASEPALPYRFSWGFLLLVLRFQLLLLLRLRSNLLGHFRFLGNLILCAQATARSKQQVSVSDDWTQVVLPGECGVKANIVCVSVCECVCVCVCVCV